jgi:hypothetical protein
MKVSGPLGWSPGTVYVQHLVIKVNFVFGVPSV